jgi:uncharacterized protein
MLPRVLTLGLALLTVSASAAPIPDYPFIFTVGTAETDIAPDTARIGFTLAARDANAKVAADAVESSFASVLTILAAAGIREADIDASLVNKSPRSHWDSASERSVADGYEVLRRINVTARDLIRYPQMLKALLQLPNTENFHAEFDRSDRPRIEAELLASAAQDARVRAERMAAPFGRKLGAVRAISQPPFAGLSEEFGFGSHAAMAGVSASAAIFKRSGSEERLLAPAAITIARSVNVIYELQAPQ